MTQSEKYQKLAELKAQMEALEATPVTTYKVWEPTEEEETVWYTQDKGEKTWYLCREDNKPFALSLGMVHPTKEAAERHHSFLVMLHDLHKFAVEHNEGWKPDWADGAEKKWGIHSGNVFHSDNVLKIGWFVYDKYNILPHFKTKDIAQKAIDTFGERLKILFEYYNS